MGLAGSDTITLIGFLFVAAMGTLLICLPRRLALLPIILTVCYMTIGQQVVIAGLHFSVIRIMIPLGWFRLVIRGELTRFRINEIDKLLLIWQVSRVAMNTLQNGTAEAFIGTSGNAYDAVGMYYLLRFLIRDLEEVPRIIRMISIAIVPLALTMLIEKSTTRNIFSVFGGVMPNTMVDEEERLRCMGPFRHPILAGTFGATLLPLFLGLRFQGGRFKLFANAGIAAATIIVLTAHSSGPVVVWALGLFGMMLWPLRHRMRVLRWGLAFSVISLHLIMKDPVWALYERLGGLIGGTGYHRTMLITAAITHFDEWWLIGTHYTAHWLPYRLRNDPTMADITNQYIYEGVIGGVLTMGLLVALISLGFRAVGRLIHLKEDISPFSSRIMVWSLGVSLFSHVSSFMSVSYFDQNVVMFFFLLACISLCSERILTEHEPARAA